MGLSLRAAGSTFTPISIEAMALENHGSLYGARGDYDRAIADLTQAFMLKPDDPDALYNRSLANEHKGDEERAKTDFDRYLSITTTKFLDSKD